MSQHPDDLPSALKPPVPTPPEVAQALESIAELGRHDVPRIPETVFKNTLLPALSAPAGTRVDLTSWLEIAGTPLRAIDVIGTDGEVLFRVPPLMRSLPTAHQEDVNFYDMVHESLLQENVHPALGQRSLDSSLRRVATGATLLDVETAKQWNTIRHRYNLPLVPIPGETGSLMAATAPTAQVTSALGISDEQEDF